LLCLAVRKIHKPDVDSSFKPGEPALGSVWVLLFYDRFIFPWRVSLVAVFRPTLSQAGNPPMEERKKGTAFFWGKPGKPAFQMQIVAPAA